MRQLVTAFWAGLWVVGMAYGCAAGGETDANGDCAVGSEACKCTTGGACDPGLMCLSNLCVDTGSAGGNGGSGSGGNGGVGAGGNGDCIPDGEGCQAVDVIFALDSSGSMSAENNALAATQSFKGVVDALAAINCGQVDFRVGVTNDYNGGFFTPSGWAGSVPWFDSMSMSNDEIAAAFTGAAQQVMATGATPAGCEHVLSTATNLAINDNTGFVRDGALLVLVLVTDVDDYGLYDQPNQHSCGNIGCTETSMPVQTLTDALVAKKAGEPKAVATVVLAGDPTGAPNTANICTQPGSCGCDGLECQAYFGTRLWEFATGLGTNGVTYNICGGAQTLPAAVNDAFSTQIDLACQELQPPQ